MKNMKKLVALLLAMCIATSLVGCGSQKSETSDNLGEVSSANPVSDDQAAADEVSKMIDAIYVQERNENTDEQCEAAKAAWDALTDAQKELVSGEFADPDYFGRDTGDASKDDPRNGDEIGENELLVVSFGTSFNDSRVADIKSIEDALQEAYPDWSVRRAFTAQIIINHVQARDGEKIDNVQQALDRAVENGVKNLVIQPTHLMYGAEYDELAETVESYQDKFESVQIAAPLLGDVGTDATVINEDKKLLQRLLPQKQLRQLDTRLWMKQRQTALHSYLWVTVLPTQQRYLTARCRLRWRLWDTTMYSSVPLRVNRKQPPAMLLLKASKKLVIRKSSFVL